MIPKGSDICFSVASFSAISQTFNCSSLVKTVSPSRVCVGGAKKFLLTFNISKGFFETYSFAIAY